MNITPLPEWVSNLQLALRLYALGRNSSRTGVIFEEPIVGVFDGPVDEPASLPVERTMIRLRRIEDHFC